MPTCTASQKDVALDVHAEILTAPLYTLYSTSDLSMHSLIGIRLGERVVYAEARLFVNRDKGNMPLPSHRSVFGGARLFTCVSKHAKKENAPITDMSGKTDG